MPFKLSLISNSLRGTKLLTKVLKPIQYPTLTVPTILTINSLHNEKT